MNLTIDGKHVEFSQDDQNIVEAAHRAGINIPAPCYRAQRKKGCCKGCVVEINGEQKYACNIKPEEGMNIVVHRDDLVQLRKERIAAYGANINKPGQQSGCDCGTSTISGSCSASCC